MGSADDYLAYSVENECLWDGPAISQGQVKCSPYGITTFSNTNQLQGQEKLREVSTLNIYRPFWDKWWKRWKAASSQQDFDEFAIFQGLDWFFRWLGPGSLTQAI